MTDSREAFEKWCPYSGNPDPHTVWMACWPIAQAAIAHGVHQSRELGKAWPTK